MGKKRLLGAGAALAAAAALTLSAGPAMAAPSSTTCGNGELPSGTYTNVFVTGDCTVPAGATITITHNVIVAPKAVFDAQAAPATITIGGSVIGGRGSMVGLGCTAAHGCESGPPFSTISVRHNIVLDHVYDAALNGLEVGGNVVSNGGGAGFVLPEQFIPFSIKDDTIHGNVIVNDLKTSWFGLIRSTVDGNAIFRNIRLDDPDGNEIVANTIGKNLICMGLSPAPQLGDAVEGAPPGYGPNTIGGRALGQCAALPQT
jgi:hypothetical protein